MSLASLTEAWLLRLSLRRLCTTSGLACIESRAYMITGETPDNPPYKTQFSNPIEMIEVNSRLKNLVKTGYLADARQMFDKMTHRDVISWTTIISGYVNAMDTSEGLSLFSKMWVEPGVCMDPFVLSLALKACGLNMSVCFGESLHGYVIKTDFAKSVFVGSALLDMYSKFGRIEQGCKVFHEMPIRNVVSWTAIITGFVNAGCYKEGLFYFSEMWRSKIDCDSYTFAIASKACADSGALDHGREIHCQAMKRGIDSSTFVANTLATMYNKCGKLDYGLRLFENMCIKDVVSWTLIITAYTQTGQEENALKAFIRMRETGAIPNEFTFAVVISGCAGLVRMEWGQQLHAHVFRLGLVDRLSVANSIMTMYAKCGLLTLASMVFQGLTTRDIVSWSTIIAGYSQGGCAEEAFEYLSWMRREGPRPNEFALSSVLIVCGDMAILEQGKQLHAHVLQVGLEHKEMVKSSLIDMYSKCGSIKEASKVFYETENYDIVSWTAMIKGFAEHGYCQEAFDLFEKIPEVGLRPDSVTFIGVLTACKHAGLVDLGFHYFNTMSKDYHICPSKEHYGCMIDLLCRAGRLSDAESMIESMPFPPDDVVWSTLLGACKVHSDAERGRSTAEKILELNPNCAGTHITLANIYAVKGRWREAANVRKMMRFKGVIKEPGWSWIKVMDLTSVFVSSDRTHPHTTDIYSMLDLLYPKKDMPVQELHSLLSEEG